MGGITCKYKGNFIFIGNYGADEIGVGGGFDNKGDGEGKGVFVCARVYLKGRYFREKLFSRKIFSRIVAP